jgi:hypothetical protein
MQERGRPHAIMGLQIEGQAVTDLKHHAGWPNLDVKRDDLSRREWLQLITAMAATAQGRACDGRPATSLWQLVPVHQGY